ncbi:MAG: SIMPL domain-containing protein [Clostridiales bacterium]|nr:SIMPL domain-containing protein [Clostridiales bacterium]
MEQKVISVTKTATKRVAANRVAISISVSGEGKKYANAVDAAASGSAAVVGEFSKLSGAALSDCGMNVTTVHADKKIVGYRAVQAYSVQFDFARDILDKAFEILSSLAVEWRVSFTYKDNGERRELLKEAVKAAHESASVIAEAASVQLGSLCKVDYSSDSAAPMMLRAISLQDRAAEPEQITLSETVTCAWAID